MSARPSLMSRNRYWAAISLIALALSPFAAWAKKADIPVIVPPVKNEDGGGAEFEEIEFNKTLVIEGRVEKPQVQFTLLKEPPPEKDIRFERSFRENILEQERENTFEVKERYDRE